MRMKLINRIKKFAQLALAFGLVSSASADQYFKFVVTHRRAGNTPYDYVEVGELALFNASGTRVNLGLTRDASLSTPNTFSFYHRGEVGSPNYETAEKLFDGSFGWVDNQQSKLTCQLINDGGQKIADPPTVIMRLTTDDEIVAYNLASAEANLGERIATGWELYRGADGTNEWILIDKRTPGDTADDPIVVNHNNTVNYTWYNSGGKGVNGKNPTTAYRIGGGSVTSWHFLDLLASDPRRVVSSPLATGGDIILKDGDDYIHVFTNAAAASTFTAKEALNARVLVVGGGGAGGYNCAGGGGAGAVIFHPSYSITEGSVLSVKVGAGGAATTDNVVGGSGGASVIRSDNEGGSLIYQADGGGGGATWGKSTTIAAGDGGCGGGGATANNDGTGDDGKGALSAGLGGGVTECTMPQGATKYGCAGGRGWRAGPSDDGAGGGGGAQTQGANGAHNIPGKGGDGVVCTILGGGLSQQAFGGGGGGGGSVNNTSDKNPASGGTGGGGAGGYNRVNATSGEDGLGGGGGGGNGGANTDSKPANGGSGLVVIRYSTMRDRWYRFTVTAVTGGYAADGSMQLSELALYDAAGNRINKGLTRDDALSSPNTCTWSWVNNKDEVVNLFDGNLNTKHCSGFDANRFVSMRITSASPAVSYNLASGDDTSNHGWRAPRAWTLEYSEDGTHWIVVDKKTSAETANDPAISGNYTWYFNGGSGGKDYSPEPTKKCAITGLTPISYVASDGTQYVNTLYTPNAKTRVVLDYEMTAENGVYLFGFAGNNYGKSLYSKNAPGSSSMRVCRDDVFNTEVEISGSTDVGVRHVLDVGTTAILLDGVAQPNYPTAHPLSASCDGSAFLFAMNQGWFPGPDSPWVGDDWVSMRVYSLKFYEDDELVFDAVPMLDAAGTPGLYDNVSGRFLKSATTTPPLLAPNCYYKVGLDSDSTGASFAKSANSTCGWSETRGGTVIANHNVSSEFEYHVDSGLVLYTTHNATADETFAGASLVLRGTLAMKGSGNTVTVNRLIAKGGAIGQWYSGFVQKLAGTISIAEGDSLTLGVTSPENVIDRRDLTIASAISGAGDLILSAARVGQGTIVLLSGDNAEFTGTIKTPDAFNNPLTLRVTGDFGGTITSLPAAEKVDAIAFNYDGLAGGSGLRVIGSEFPAALKTKLTFFSATTDFNQMNLPLVTFPAGQFLQASDFTVKHATSVGGSGTAFTGLAIIPNGDGTETLVANAASGIYFVTAEATAGTGTGLSWLSPLTLQEAFTAICGAAVGSTNAIYMKVGTYTNPSGPWTATINPCFIRILGGYTGVSFNRSQTDYSVLDGENAHGLVSVTVSSATTDDSKSILFDQIEFRHGQGAYKITNNDTRNYWSQFNHCRFIDNVVPASDTSIKGSAIEVTKGMSWVSVENCEFRGNKACTDYATTIYAAARQGDYNCGLNLSHSLFVGNSSKVRPCVAQFGGSKDNNVTIESCTFAYNAVATEVNRADSKGGLVLDQRDYLGPFAWKVSDTIFYGNRCNGSAGVDYNAWSPSGSLTGTPKPQYLLFENATAYSFGTVDATAQHYLFGDPMFVTPKPTVTFDTTSYMPTWSVDPSAMDVHLKSVGGRWNGSAWVKDDAMSPAIDAGDPKADYSLEPSPNGGRINLGAYGNTAEASKSVAETDAATVSSASGYSEIKQLDNGHTVLIYSNVTDAASFTVAKGGYARVLVVGGGGNGGNGSSGYGGGGGGAGGVVASDAQMLDAGEYTVVVGNSAKDSSLKNSAETVLITAVGGGAGGAGYGLNSGANGGSGGGGGGFSSQCSGGEGVSGQGNAGGYNNVFAGGGGGGFSSAGKSAPNTLVGGDGGNGYASDITGEMYGYACGGGGSGSSSGTTQTMGVGGSVTVDGVKLILGGNGSKEKGGDAVSGTGSGGGGGCSNGGGGKGGSGIVVVHLYTRWDPSQLPEGYTALDYLDNGSDPATAGFVQVTGFKLASANIVELKFSVNEDAKDRWQTLFMSRVKNGDKSADYGLFRGYPAGSEATLNYHHRDDSGAAAVGNEGATAINTDHEVRLGPSKDDCKINGEAMNFMDLNLEPKSYSISLTNDLLIFATDKNTVCDGYPYLKRVNDGSLVNPALAKMYYFQVFASSTDLTPRLDLVPASNTLSHAVGLYDLVGNEFYPLRHPCPGATVVDGHAVDELHHADPSLTACGYDCGVCTSCLMRISKMIPPVQGDREWRWNGQPHRPHITETNDYWGVAGCAISYNPPNTEWTGEKTFTMTNMLVNPCVWLDGTTTNVVYTYTCLPAFFSVIRPGGPQIEVKKSWLNYAYKNIQDYDEYQDFLFSTNANGVAAWQAYVLGAEAKPEAVANAAILEESVQNANPETVTIKLRDWETLTPRTNENCRLAYSLLSARTTSELLANGGTVVTNRCVSPSVPYEKCPEWSFEAPLSDLTDDEPVNYYRIKVHFLFGGGK